MKMNTRLILAILLCLSTFSAAGTVQGNPGESAPGNHVTPTSATPFDVVQFSLDADSHSYGNSCEQENGFDGILTLEIDHEVRIVDVTAVEPAPSLCNRIYAPVTGVRGEIDSLSSGHWLIQDWFGNALTVNVVHAGDANKDGRFNSSDFVQVFQAGEYEDDIPQNSTWEEGDWTGDREFTSSDFVAAFRSLPQPGVVQVPEPISNPLFIGVAGIAMMFLRRGRHPMDSRGQG